MKITMFFILAAGFLAAGTSAQAAEDDFGPTISRAAARFTTGLAHAAGKAQADINCRKEIALIIQAARWTDVPRAWYRDEIGTGYGLNYRGNGNAARCETDRNLDVVYLTINSEQLI